MRTLTFALLVSVCLTAAPDAQGPSRAFRGRLSPMPLDLAMAVNMTGSGTVTATLAGSTLTLAGTFEGLKTPATVARLQKSAKPGMRGEPVVEIQVTKAVSGTVSATLDLTPPQMQDLLNGRLYIQIHSERAPDGNLWGWLLAQESKR